MGFRTVLTAKARSRASPCVGPSSLHEDRMEATHRRSMLRTTLALHIPTTPTGRPPTIPCMDRPPPLPPRPLLPVYILDWDPRRSILTL